MADLDWPLDEGYRIERYADGDVVSADDVLALWKREGVVDGDEAQRRVAEVHLVAVHGGEELVGVSTAYLRHNARLGMDLWYYRAFVASAHRRSNVAVQLALSGRDDLSERFTSGVDVRGAGIVYVVENQGLKRAFNQAVWFPTLMTFIGESDRGDHVRVHYFPGATAPGPRGEQG
jgi:hypothetical protein